MAETKLIPIVVYVSKNLREELREKQKEGYSLSFLTRKFLIEGLERMKK